MDVAESLAADLNKCSGFQEPALVEDFWPLCGLLQEEGLLVGSDERLATVGIGPFRLAHTRYENATRDFVEVLVPATLAGMADGRLIHGTLSGVLIAAGNTFIQLLRRGVSFSRRPEDKLRWTVLLYIKRENSRSHFPSREQAIQQLSPLCQNVDEVVEWLLGSNAKPFIGDSPVQLLRARNDGGLEALV